MYRIFITLAALVAMTACGGGKVTEEQYDEQMAQIQETLKGQLEAISDELSEEEASAQADKLYDEAVDQMVAYALKVAKKNADQSVAVKAIGDIYYYAEPEEVEAAIKGLSEENKADAKIQKILSGITAKKGTKEGLLFTDFTVEQVEGDETSKVSLSDYVGKGKYILVDFWASWCGPCRREIPNIASVYEKYAGEDFDVLSIAVWDKPEDTVKAAEEHGVVWKQIINAQRIPTDIYGIDGIPHIILFGPDGTILKRDLRGAAIEEEVAKYVKAK